MFYKIITKVFFNKITINLSLEKKIQIKLKNKYSYEKISISMRNVVRRTISICKAWQGKGDQKKLQVGFNGYGNGTGITGTYDYGVSDVISLEQELILL